MSKSPSLRRIQADVRELALDPSDRYYAMPLENDMFEWHFTIRGAEGTDFEGGVYHGRILLPPDYPFKPPHILFLTPSGRFETNTKVCLSFSAYHPELWQPAWGIRLILEALISFLPTPADGAIGALDWSSKERKRLAQLSQTWDCPCCGRVANLIPKKKLAADGAAAASPAKSRFQKEIEELQRLQQLEHKKDDESENVHAVEEIGAIRNEAKQETSSPQKQQQSSEDYDNNDKSEAVPLLLDDDDDESEKKKQSTGSPPPATNTVGAATTTTTTVVTTTTSDEPPAIVAAQQHPLQLQQSASSSWVSDPVMHGITLILSIIAYLLIRKVQLLIADIQALD